MKGLLFRLLPGSPPGHRSLLEGAVGRYFRVASWSPDYPDEICVDVFDNPICARLILRDLFADGVTTILVGEFRVDIPSQFLANIDVLVLGMCMPPRDWDAWLTPERASGLSSGTVAVIRAYISS